MASAQRLQVVLNHLQSPVQPSVKRTTANNQYVYTLDNNLLTEEQRAFYELNGFIVIPKLIEDKLLDECRQRFVDICNGVVTNNKLLLMKDKSLKRTSARGEFLYYKIQHIAWDDVMSNYVHHSKMLEYVECFTGPDISAIHSMIVNKPPDAGKLTSVHPLHQDLHYFPFRPIERMVASWTAMEKITVENGCLFVIPGTHKSALQPHDYPDNDVNEMFYEVKGFDLVPRLNLEMEKGDTVFFHPLIMHGSGPNLTKGFRKAISCHYISNNCDYVDVQGTPQENVAKEVIEIVKRRGMDVNFKEYFNFYKIIVKGTPDTLN